MTYIHYLDMIGIIAFALSGYMLAARAGLDLLGIVLVSLITAFGGGIIRDVMVDRSPFVFTETYPFTVMLLSVAIAYCVKLHKRVDLDQSNIFLISDSIGLSVFAVTGATIAITAGFNFGGIVLLALLTAIGGGVIRDIVLNQVPYVFRSDFYGTVAIIIGVLIGGVAHWGQLSELTTNCVLIFGIALRLCAAKRRWKLPGAMRQLPEQ